MKRIKTMAVAALCVLAMATGVEARSLNNAEDNAQKAMMTYLRSLNYSPVFDNEDNSVNFKRNDVLYWITVSGNSNGILYTLHHKRVRLRGEKDGAVRVARRNEQAQRAANMMNVRNPYKTYVTGNRVEFAFPVYAATVQDYQEVFPRILNSMKDVNKEFDICMKRSRIQTDSIHTYWANYDTVRKVLPQRAINVRQSPKMLAIENISVRNVDAAGNEISGYDESIRKGKLKYMQPRVTMRAVKPGVYKLGLKIINPHGKVLVPGKEATYTTVTTIDAEKAKKPVQYELDVFGTNDTNWWEPGEYKLLFYEDDTKIYEDAMHVL